MTSSSTAATRSTPTRSAGRRRYASYPVGGADPGRSGARIYTPAVDTTGRLRVAAAVGINGDVGAPRLLAAEERDGAIMASTGRVRLHTLRTERGAALDSGDLRSVSAPSSPPEMPAPTKCRPSCRMPWRSSQTCARGRGRRLRKTTTRAGDRGRLRRRNQIDPARSNRDEIGQMLLDENATSTGPGHSFPRGVAEPLFSSVCHARQHRAWLRADGHLAVAEILSSSPSLAVSRGRSVIGRGPTGPRPHRTAPAKIRVTAAFVGSSC